MGEFKAGEVVLLESILRGEPDYPHRYKFEGLIYEVTGLDITQLGNVVNLRCLFGNHVSRPFLINYIRCIKLMPQSH